MVYNWTNQLQSRLFPSICRLCRAPGLPGVELCASCRAELPWITRSCHRCALPLPPNYDISLCFNCIKKRPAIDACRALFAYRPPLEHWIQALKFSQDLGTARLLGTLLVSTLAQDHRQKPAIVLPVPLHRKRLAKRGYNQALEIARSLSDVGYRLDPTCCRRHRPTSAQSELHASARKQNVRNAFSVSAAVEGRCVLLIDDVMTTGATLDELARTVKKAGAQRVEAWVIARTVADQTGHL